MESILLIVNSVPSSSNVERAFQSALTLRAQGNSVSVFLLQDAVLAGLQAGSAGASRLVAQATRAGICVYALAEDLALRGFTALKLREGICGADYAQLVELFEQHSRVIGAL